MNVSRDLSPKMPTELPPVSLTTLYDEHRLVQCAKKQLDTSAADLQQKGTFLNTTSFHNTIYTKWKNAFKEAIAKPKSEVETKISTFQNNITKGVAKLTKLNQKLDGVYSKGIGWTAPIGQAKTAILTEMHQIKNSIQKESAQLQKTINSISQQAQQIRGLCNRQFELIKGINTERQKLSSLIKDCGIAFKKYEKTPQNASLRKQNESNLNQLKNEYIILNKTKRRLLTSINPKELNQAEKLLGKAEVGINGKVPLGTIGIALKNSQDARRNLRSQIGSNLLSMSPKNLSTTDKIKAGWNSYINPGKATASDQAEFARISLENGTSTLEDFRERFLGLMNNSNISMTDKAYLHAKYNEGVKEHTALNLNEQGLRSQITLGTIKTDDISPTIFNSLLKKSIQAYRMATSEPVEDWGTIQKLINTGKSDELLLKEMNDDPELRSELTKLTGLVKSNLLKADSLTQFESVVKSNVLYGDAGISWNREQQGAVKSILEKKIVQYFYNSNVSPQEKANFKRQLSDFCLAMEKNKQLSPILKEPSIHAALVKIFPKPSEALQKERNIQAPSPSPAKVEAQKIAEKEEQSKRGIEPDVRHRAAKFGETPEPPNPTPIPLDISNLENEEIDEWEPENYDLKDLEDNV